MSDEDFMLEDEDFGFEYEEEEGSEEENGIENKYYNAKAQRGDFATAKSEFEQLMKEDQQAGSSDWGFKATKQIIKLCLRERKLEEVLQFYDKMLEYVRSSLVARNYAEKSINNMLERVSVSTNDAFSREFYQRTLDLLKGSSSDRLWLRTSLRLANILLDQKEYAELRELLIKLKRSCEDKDGHLIMERGTQLLEVNSIFLHMYEEQGNSKKLKETYLQCEAVTSAVPHPRIMGYIHKCGGKIHMSERNWAKAQACFFEAFRQYNEAGTDDRVNALKYVLLASMLSESEVNPLSSPEAKAHENDPTIKTITKLVSAYEKRDVHAFEEITKSNETAIAEDSFIVDYISDLRRIFLIQVLEGVAIPYTRVRIKTLAERLCTDVSETEQLLIALILDKRLNASIDQENGVLLMQQETTDMSQYKSLDKWAAKLSALMQSSYGIIG
ncbi:PCI-domain-containing protein [Coemansia reversa NRRL 1564]|uniref:PCI-domain-containing protein n=1 Tax=Coemansia reversa (strain ATCC 12441 / NRRL 1564) TaxID=763665 RepID=A0A2G5BEL3_COERN|nr:PCI-domain-containing protein [Coemansia reversa NRRL 1564]|eukprot:PIA17147.1 PCI-domain-containing protein [Coemansia reversa NRRL 1564]